MTENAQTGDYTIAVADFNGNTYIAMNKATAVVLTVDKSANKTYPTNVPLVIINKNSGTCTITPIDGAVTINSAGNKYGLAQDCWCVLIMTASNVFRLEGNLA